ncbi:leucine-rich repeat domain-containing protein [Paenibacillus sp. strain BS8-2]
MQRTILDDLQSVEVITDEMIIKPTTKNIHLLNSKRIEHLNIYSFNQKQLEKEIQNFNVKSITFYEFRVEDLSPLESLVNVENLSLTWNTKAIGLWNTGMNTQLKQLTLSDFSKLKSIEQLRLGKSLEVLELSGGIWNTLKIDSLKPLSELERLMQLTLTNIKVNDQSLEPLLNLSHLEVLVLSNQFPVEEYAKLSVGLPETECELFKPYTMLVSPIEDKDVMITGKGKPFLNSITDAIKIKSFETKFQKLQEQFSHSKK